MPPKGKVTGRLKSKSAAQGDASEGEGAQLGEQLLPVEPSASQAPAGRGGRGRGRGGGRGRGRGHGQAPPAPPASTADPTHSDSDSDIHPTQEDAMAEEGAEEGADGSSPASDGEQQPKAGAKGRKKRETFTLDTDDENDIVEWLQADENQFIWDSKSRKWHKKDLIKGAWEQTAPDIHLAPEQKSPTPGESLSKWWKNIKDQWCRLHRKKSGQALETMTERDNWVWRNCHFLDKVVKHRAQSVRPIHPPADVLDAAELEAMAEGQLQEEEAEEAAHPQTEGRAPPPPKEEEIPEP